MRRVFRYEVPVDDGDHEFTLTSDPVAAVTRVDGPARHTVEFWAEHDNEAAQVSRRFRVFGTGHPVPAGMTWRATCPRTDGLVWHLFEVTGEDGTSQDGQ